MFKPARKKSLKGKEKVEFKLEFHASRVPHRGWDKLLVSLISLETNKVTAKTGKALVKNGACQWSEPVFFEAAFLAQDSSGKDTSKALYKLMVSMGLSRFGILGEATIDLADYEQAVVPVSLPLQLQNCSSGSILHVKIQRIGPKSATREMEDQREVYVEEDCNAAFFDGSQKGYDQKGAESPASTDKDESVSTSRLSSSDSVEGPQTPELSESRLYRREGRGEELASPCSSIGSCSGRQELGNIFQDYARFSRTDMANQRLMNEYNSLAENSNLLFPPPQSGKSSEDKNRVDFSFGCEALPSWATHKVCEDEEKTIKDLRLEAASWKQQVTQMEAQMEILNKQLAEESRRSGELQRELASLGEERDSIQLEINKLQLTAKVQERAGEGFNWQELQEELEYEKSMNSNLSLQLRKTQESNSELLLEIQDLEKVLQEKEGLENQTNVVLQHEKAEKELRTTVDSLKKELEELERDSKELTEENMGLIADLKQANDKLKLKESTITRLEAKIESESYLYTEIETEKLRTDIEEMRAKLRECEESHESKLVTSRTLIDDLNSSVVMVRTKNARLERELQSSEENISELLKEIELLKSEISGHDREKSALKGQLKGLREKASKAEQDHMFVLKRVEELEVIIRELKGEKTRDLTAIKKKLEDFQAHALATDNKYRDALKDLSHVREEKSKLDKELAILLQTKEAAEAAVAQLQSFNMVLQEKLHLEQLKNSELLQECEGKEAISVKLHEDLQVKETQLKVLEQNVTELKTVGKEMEDKAGCLQGENMVCRSHAKELELQVASLEKEIHALQTSRSACEAELQCLQVGNEELAEKLKNAQEDIEWARENTNTLVNEIRELEGEIESDMAIQKQMKQSVADMELQKQSLQSHIEELSSKNVHLEKEVLSLEERCKDVSKEKDACLVSIQEQKNAQENLEASLQTLIKQQEEKIQQLLVSSGENRVQQALLDARVLREEKAELEEKLKCLQDMLNQVKQGVSDDEKRVKHALLEASMLADEKLELEENVLKLEEMLKQAEKYSLSLKQNLDFQFQEARVKEQEMKKKLDKATAEAQLLQDEKLDYLQKIMALEAQCAAGELEKKKVFASTLKKERELEVLQREKEDRERALAGLKEENDKLRSSLGNANQEMATWREASNLWEQSKASMEEKILQLQGSAVKESYSEFNNLKKQTNELRLRLSQKEEDKEELKKQVISLEEEIQHKDASLALLEKELEDKESLALPAACETKDSVNWHERVVALEGELKSKSIELESLEQLMKEKHYQLSSKIEQLELANNQLVKEQASANMDELVKELNSLQKKNAAFSQREHELLSKISSQEALQIELNGLKEEKSVLELALSNFDASVNGENISKRIAELEMELTEVLEANIMYKKELQSAFAKQHNVHAAALENLGSVEKVIQDLADLKRKNMMLEDELKDMRERYFNMSLQFAEVEAEREELVMTIRTLRGGPKKLMHHRSLNF